MTVNRLTYEFTPIEVTTATRLNLQCSRCQTGAARGVFQGFPASIICHSAGDCPLLAAVRDADQHEKILDSLEWEDTDSGKDLKERGKLGEEAKRQAGKP